MTMRVVGGREFIAHHGQPIQANKNDKEDVYRMCLP